MFYNFHQLGIDVHGHTSGRVKTYCPRCRDSRHNKADKSLSVNLDEGVFKCHYCGWSGKAEDGSRPETAQDLQSAKPSKPKAPRTPQPGRLLQYVLPTSESGELSKEQMEWLTGKRKLSAEAIIVEGKLDAAAFVTAGRTDVVSVPGGTNRNLTWMDRFMETHFEDKQTVYIAVDTDTKGTELRDELLRRLGAERCRICCLFQPGEPPPALSPVQAHGKTHGM